jgi:predicted transcriptional regulator
MKIPCEIIVWRVLPVIRREFARNMIKNHKLTQKKTAQNLGLTEAAVSRYVSGKRGTSEILDGEILKEITKSVNQIVEGNGTSMIEETCRICRLIKASRKIDGISYPCI